jgi:pimeloyl-ACP methyl ester carboxylesterase
LVAFIIRRLAYGNPSLVTPRVIDEYWAPTQLPGFVRAGHDALVEFDWSPVAPPRRAALNAPLLVLLGRKDHLIRSDAAAALTLPNAAVHELDGGHCAHEEEPERAYALLGDFIDAVA